MTPSQSKTERFNTVIIGAGQNGLATGYHLSQRKGVDFVIIDSATRVGTSWRNRWDSLKLFTEAYWNDLPGMKFPSEDRKYFPNKDEVADFLEAYAARFALPVRLGVTVKKVTRDGDGYVVDTSAGRLEAQNVVVATGPFQKPRTPAFAPELDPSIVQMHSASYRNASQLKDGPTLVVGAATSGCQIAMELVKSRKVFLSGPDVASMPPWIEKMLGPIVPWFMSRQRHTFLGKKLYPEALKHGHPLVLFTYKDVLKSGVERVARTVAVRDGKPMLEGENVLDVANVIWSTGYTVDFSWIDLPVFEENGYPKHHRGVVEGEPGLYFVGLVFLHSLSSQLIKGVERDTKYITDELFRRRESRQPAEIKEPGFQVG